MIVQELYSGTLRLNELLRQSEEFRSVLEDRIQVLEAEIKIKQASQEISDENNRYLEKQALALHLEREELSAKFDELSLRNQELLSSNQKWEQRAIQAENISTGLKQHIDSVHMRRVVYKLKNLKENRWRHCATITFLLWKRFRKRKTRRNFFVAELAKHQRTTLAIGFQSWRQLQISSKLLSYQVQYSFIKCSIVDIFKQINDCQQSCITAARDVEMLHEEFSINIRDSSQFLLAQSKLQSDARRQVRVIRVVRFLNTLTLKYVCNIWCCAVEMKRRNKRLRACIHARQTVFLLQTKRAAWRSWLEEIITTKLTRICKSVTGSVAINNAKLRYSHDLKLVELNPKKLLQIRIANSRTLKSACLPFNFWRSETKLQRADRQFLQQTLSVRPSRCRRFFRKCWVVHNWKFATGGSALSAGCLSIAAQGPSLIKNLPSLCAAPLDSAICMFVFNLHMQLERFLGFWAWRSRWGARQRKMQEKFKRFRVSRLMLLHLVAWIELRQESKSLADHVRTEALTQELVDMAKANVAAESRLAIARQQILDLQKVATDQMVSIVNLENHTRDANEQLRRAQESIEVGEQRLTVARVLRALAVWKHSRSRRAWNAWIMCKAYSRFRRLAATRVRSKAASASVRRAFGAWDECVMDSVIQAEERWVESLQQQLAALAGLQAATETQLGDALRENTELMDRATARAQEFERLQRTVSVMYLIRANRFCKFKSLGRAWFSWYCTFKRHAFRRSAIIQILFSRVWSCFTARAVAARTDSCSIQSSQFFLTKELVQATRLRFDCFTPLSVKRACHISAGILKKKDAYYFMLLNKLCLFEYWGHWLQRRILQARCNRLRSRYHRFLCNRGFTLWVQNINEQTAEFSRLVVKNILLNIKNLLNNYGHLISKTPLENRKPSQHNIHLIHFLQFAKRSMSSHVKADNWRIAWFSMKLDSYFRKTISQSVLYHWKIQVTKVRKLIRSTIWIAAKQSRQSIFKYFLVWIDFLCKKMIQSAKTKNEPQSEEIGVNVVEDSGSQMTADAKQSFLQTVNVQPWPTMTFRNMKAWAFLLKQTRDIQEANHKVEIQKLELNTEQIQAESSLKCSKLVRIHEEQRLALETELENLKIQMNVTKRGKIDAERELSILTGKCNESHETKAVIRIMRVLRFCKQQLLLRAWWNFQKWFRGKRRRHLISCKVVAFQNLSTIINTLMLWSSVTIESKLAAKDLKIASLEESCSSALLMKGDAEARLISMIELKKDLEKIWSQKHLTAVQVLERKLADTKHELDKISIEFREKKLSIAVVQILRFVTYLRKRSCQYYWRVWRRWCSWIKFLRKIVLTFVKCTLGQAFDWWVVQAENLKAQALESSAYSLENQLIIVNERLHKRLQTSETLVRYVLDEQEQIQAVWDRRHRALRSNLEIQLAQANQMRLNLGNMFSELKKKMSFVRVLHVLKFWKRQSLLQRFKFWKERFFSRRQILHLGERGCENYIIRVRLRHWSLWILHHYNCNMENLNKVIVDTQLAAAKDINLKEQDMKFFIDQVKQSKFVLQELSMRLKSTPVTVRETITADLAWVVGGLDTWKAEAAVLKLEAEQQDSYEKFSAF